MGWSSVVFVRRTIGPPSVLTRIHLALFVSHSLDLWKVKEEKELVLLLQLDLQLLEQEELEESMFLPAGEGG